MRQRLLAVTLLAPLLAFPFSSCSQEDEASRKGGPQDGSISREYTLSINDTRAEVRQTCTAGSEVPWAIGPQARRCESHLLTTQDGFAFPDAFLAYWPEELTRVLVDYEHPQENGYAYSGWILYDSPGTSEPSAQLQFREPLVFISAQGRPSQTTTRASIMKRDSTSLFDPRGDQAGKPELEGEGIATLVCDNVVRGDGTVRVDYDLRVAGEGFIRYYDPNGDEWLLTGDEQEIPGDKEERCTFEIGRRGVKEFSRDTAGQWYVREDTFQETWQAESTEGEATVHESSMSGPDAAYSFVTSQLPERKNQETPVFDVRDFGAAGDGATLDTSAINAAITACHDQGRGLVRFPPSVYLAGSIHMKSNVALRLEKGTILRGTTDMSRYDPRENNPWSDFQDNSHSYFHRSLIWGENLENIGILGPGVIDGDDAFEPWPGWTTTPPAPFGWMLSTLLYQIDEDLFQRGPKPIAFKACRNVLIKDITIMHAPDEAILVTGCNSVLIDGYTAREVRVDGLDPDGCERVTIANCEIRSLDDAIAIKSGYALGKKTPCREVTVRDCLLSTFINALKLGTESVGDFENILFRDCVIDNLPGFPSFAGLSMISADGGKIDGLAASNIRMKNVNYPIFIRLGDRLRSPENPSVGSVRNISVSNVRATGGIGTGASLIISVPGSHVGEGIRLDDIEIICRGGGSLLSSFLPVPEVRESEGAYPDPPYIVPGKPPAYGFFCRHARGLTFRNVRLGFEIPDRRAALITEDVEGLLIEGLEAQTASRGAPSVITR